MKVGILFNANQTKGGVFQYSMSVVNSLKQNEYITELIVYTNNKDLVLENSTPDKLQTIKTIFAFLVNC